MAAEQQRNILSVKDNNREDLVSAASQLDSKSQNIVYIQERKVEDEPLPEDKFAITNADDLSIIDKNDGDEVSQLSDANLDITTDGDNLGELNVSSGEEGLQYSFDEVTEEVVQELDFEEDCDVVEDEYVELDDVEDIIIQDLPENDAAEDIVSQ